jgi:membrane-associated PAP2 superfamily phosphatase
VVASVTLATLAVSLLKSLTRMDCPWDLLRYGGTRPFIGMFEARHGLAASGCFPAGHASAGYAWVALYFAALAARPAWRWAGLAIGLAGGALFGVSQQLRGAHFLSHDLWSLATCWLVALALYLLMLRGRRQPAPEMLA